MRICKTCGKTKPLTEFWSSGIHNGTRYYKSSCKACHYPRIRAIFWDRVKSIKGNLSCEICGYARNLAALEFHHRNPNEKDIEVSRMYTANMNRLTLELNKCDLLCANCHREKHHPVSVKGVA